MSLKAILITPVPEQPASPAAHPKLSLAILKDGPYRIVGQGIGILGISPVNTTIAVIGIEDAQPVHRTDPKITGNGIFGDVKDPVF